MSVKQYSENESLERIYYFLKGENPIDDENFLGRMSKNEALARIVQLLENSGDESLEVNFPGTLTFTDTFWDDLRVPMNGARPGISNDPDFTVWSSVTGSNQGVFLWWFDDTTEEELYFAVQLPHNYKLGTNLHPHIHWIPQISRTGTVSWGLEYTYANTADTFATTRILYSNTPTPNDYNLVANKHYMTEFGEIDGSGFLSVSSMLVCRVFRNASGISGSSDVYTADAGLLEVDFHYEVDSIGSRSEYTK